jgi:hypothetical protein
MTSRHPICPMEDAKADPHLSSSVSPRFPPCENTWLDGMERRHLRGWTGGNHPRFRNDSNISDGAWGSAGGAGGGNRTLMGSSGGQFEPRLYGLPCGHGGYRMGQAVARNSVVERKWVKDSQHFPAELRDFRVRAPRCPVNTGALSETSSSRPRFHARKPFRWALSSWGKGPPPPGFCSPCPDGPPGTPGRIPGGNPRPDGQPPRRVESPCFTPVHCVRQRSARDQWSIGRPQPPAPLVALAYFQLRGGCVAVHGRAMFCSPAPSKSPSFLPLNSSFRLTGLLRIRILPVPEGAIRGRGRTRLRSARPKGRADRASPVNSIS